MLILQIQYPQETEEADESKSCAIINLCVLEQRGEESHPATCRRVKNARLGLREEPSVLEARALYPADTGKKASLCGELCNNLIYKHPGEESKHTHIWCMRRINRLND